MFCTQYQTRVNEIISIVELGQDEVNELLTQSEQSDFNVLWNIGETAIFSINGQTVSLEQNCVLFLKALNELKYAKFTSLRIISFNHAFFCKEQKLIDFGCQGLLFFGTSNISKIILTDDLLSFYKWAWKWFVKELQLQNEYKLELLQKNLDMIIALSTRTFKIQNIKFMTDNFEVDIIRKYHYLVEKHYKMITKVEAYAKMLTISPKSLSNIFNKYDDKSPSKVIKERRQLQAVRLLKNTSKSIKEIANELSFLDIYTFSRFFKTNTGLSPSHYREKLKK